MSLQVWLPLNESLENKGLANITVSAPNGSFVDSGKIGKCMQGYVTEFDIPSMVGKKKISIAYWVKINTATATNWLDPVHYHTRQPDGTARYTNRMEFYSNCTKCGFWYDRSAISNKDMEVGVWTHFVAIADYETGNVWLYKNGELVIKKTDADTNVIIDGLHFGIGESGLDISVNDVRIYDHCLSQKEVKEIYKALILHYTLDDPYIEATTNLLGAKSEIFTSWGSYGFSSKGTITVANVEPAISGQVALVSNNSGSAANAEIATVFSDSTMSKGDSITVSAYVKGIGSTIGKQCKIHMYNTNGTDTISTGTFFTLTDKWQRVSHTLTWTYDTASKDRGNIYVFCYRDDGEAFYVCNCQAEKKSYMTPYVSGSRSNGITVYDSSGYKNNGIANNITVLAESPRYKNCSVFSGSTAYIKVSENNWMAQYATEMTINLWAYSENWAGVTNGRLFSCTESGGFNTEAGNSGYWRFPIYVATNADHTSHGYKYDSSEIKISDLATGWHMFTFIYTTSGTKTYIDGQLHHSYNYTSYGIKYNTGARLYLGCEASGANPSSPYFIGRESDFRLYYTALSAQDILELYQVSSSVDRNGNLWAYEFKEADV